MGAEQKTGGRGIWKEPVRQYIAEHQQELLELTLQLCQIPAPTGQEDARAAFCRDWLRRSGAGDVTIDRAKNVICTIGA